MSTSGFLAEHKGLFNAIRTHLTRDNRVYLVGGVVRDILLDKIPNDIDLVIEKESRKISQWIANDFSGDFYALDEERHTYRVILHSDEMPDLVLDIAGMRGMDIAADLADRDFTINAIALDISSEKEILWVDPLSGRRDIDRKIIRACSAESLESDPVRVFRAIRFANQLQYDIEENTIRWMQNAVAGIENISGERIRDEVFKALGKSYSSGCLSLYPQFGLIETLFPTLTSTYTKWGNELNWIANLNQAFWDQAESIPGSGFESSGIEAYQAELGAYLQTTITADRSILALLDLSILFSIEWAQINEEAESSGTEEFSLYHFIKLRAEQFVLSNHETEFLYKLIKNWDIFSELENKKNAISDVEIYRFFKSLENAGLGICLLGLTTPNVKNNPIYSTRFRMIESLFNAFFNCHESVIAPKVFLNGHDLINKFKLQPGPKFKKILEALAEVQVAGEVRNRSEAFRFVEKFLE